MPLSRAEGLQALPRKSPPTSRTDRGARLAAAARAVRGDRPAREPQPEARTIWTSFWFVFPALCFLPAVALAGYTSWWVERKIDDIAAAESTAVTLQREAVNVHFNEMAMDICAFARQNELRNYLETGDSAWIAAMAQEYLAVAQNAPHYGQIRYIDGTGMEILRVNANTGNPYIVPESDLQDQSDRYYISGSDSLRLNEIYISPLDLNLDHGYIQIPHNPVVRATTPVFSADGERRGLVVINYMAQSMLQRVDSASVASVGNTFMLNAQGYWLLSDSPSQAFGFMFADQFDERMSTRYPEAWAHMIANSSGQIRTPKGLFTFDSYYPLAQFGTCHDASAPGRRSEGELGMRFYGEYRWILTTHVPNQQLDRIFKHSLTTSLAIGFPMILLLAVGTRSVGVTVAQRQQHRLALEALARIDALTHLPNRTTFEDHLHQEYRRAKRHDRRFAVLYIDLDGFKAVNDQHGHMTGDQVLRDVAGILARGCRAVDTAARLGGDEFAVLLSEVRDKAAVGIVADRLLQQIKRLDYDGCPIGASIGAALWPDDGDDPAAIVQRADQAMYAAKRAGKNRIEVVGDD